MSLPMRPYLEQGIGLDLSCWCGRFYSMTAERALQLLDPDMTYVQAANRFTCQGCGAHGHPRIGVRFSVGDYYRLCAAVGGRTTPKG